MYARIRRDLLNAGLDVPIGRDHYSNNPGPFFAVWKGDRLYVFHTGALREVVTTDWEFEWEKSEAWAI